MLGRGRKIAHLPWSGQVTHAVAGQLERVVRPHVVAHRTPVGTETATIATLIVKALWEFDY